VDGGTGYYGRFASGLPTSSGYFPIGVWGAYDFTAANVAKDKDVGLNLYVWNASISPEEQANIANGGLYTLQEVDRQENIGAHTRGWMLRDEADMNSGGPGTDTTNCTGPNVRGEPSGYQAMRAAMAKVPDNRMTYANYGKGVAGPQWETDAEAACFINEFQDVASADIYFHTDWNEQDWPMAGTSWGYGETVDRLRYLDGLDGKRKPIWNFVEVGWPMGVPPSQSPAGYDFITPAEIRGAVWHSLIAGARGIIYFQHTFSGGCETDHALRLGWGGTPASCYGAVIDMVRSVDGQIKTLAPVLNAPSVTSGWAATGAKTRVSVKWDGQHFYVFAASYDGGTASFSMPCLGDATAVNQGETVGNLSIPVRGGTLTDQFADGDAVHIYRIDGGSTCGLSPS
jgi:hypothetical protein